MGGRGYSSATSRQAGSKSARMGRIESSGFGMKMNAETLLQDEALKAWGSDNEIMSYRNIIASQMGVGGNEKAAEYADALERMIGKTSYKKEIWRGVGLTKKGFAQLKAGEEWQEHNTRNTLSSWSDRNGVALEFARGGLVSGKGEIPVLFVMKSGTKYGKSIAKHAEGGGRGWESEVLVSRRSKLNVDWISEKFDGGFYIVEVSEK